jgi:hypothetical protein
MFTYICKCGFKHTYIHIIYAIIGILDGQRMKKKKRKGDGPKARDKEVCMFENAYEYKEDMCIHKHI